MRFLRSFRRQPFGALTFLLCSTASISTAYAADLPQGGTLASGSSGQVKISVAPNQQSMTITQTGPVAALNWRSFSIGANNLVDVRQSKPTDLLINRVLGNEASLINGTLMAKGNIFLINPNGITIGASGKVSTGGFLASTLDISGSAGTYSFSGFGAEAVDVDGRITGTGATGFIVLLGGHVTLGKTASLNAAHIALGAGESANLTLPTATKDMTFRENPTFRDPNAGAIPATGGAISIAGTVVSKNGSLIIDAGGTQSQISVEGTISVSNSKVSISLENPIADLRVGNATGARRGAINFAPNQPNTSLKINGVTYKLIWTIDELRNISNDMNGYYALAQNIDFQDAPAFIDTVIPASNSWTVFRGGLNGLGHKLSNIRISASAYGNAIGLFGKIAGSSYTNSPRAFVNNLGLSNIQIAPSADTWRAAYVGGIAGLATNFVASNNWVTGTIQTHANGQNWATIGGLVGSAGAGENQFLGNYFSGKIIGQPLAESRATVGGIVGEASSVILRDNKVARSTLSGGLRLGGISGYVMGFESSGNSFDGSITSWNTTPDKNIHYYAAMVGGLYGGADGGIISGDIAQGNIDARGPTTAVGGLVGDFFWGGPSESGNLQVAISNSQFLRGTIRGGSNGYVGGIVGRIKGYLITESFPDFEAMRNVSANANIYAGANAYAGGIAGYTDLAPISGPIEPGDVMRYSLLSSTGSITVGAGSSVGGIFGRFRDWAQGMMSSMDIRTNGVANNVGGIAGINDGTITDTIFVGRLNLARARYKGSLVGLMTSAEASYLGVSVYDLAIGIPAVGAAPQDPEVSDGGVGPISDQDLPEVGALTIEQMKYRFNLLNFLSRPEDSGDFTYFTMVDGQLPTLKTAQ